MSARASIRQTARLIDGFTNSGPSVYWRRLYVKFDIWVDLNSIFKRVGFDVEFEDDLPLYGGLWSKSVMWE